MAYVFYGQDTLVEHNKRYDEIGIFLPNSHFLKHLEKHIEKPRRLSMRKNNTASASAASYVDIMEKTTWKFHGMIMQTHATPPPTPIISSITITIGNTFFIGSSFAAEHLSTVVFR